MSSKNEVRFSFLADARSFGAVFNAFTSSSLASDSIVSPSSSKSSVFLRLRIEILDQQRYQLILKMSCLYLTCLSEVVSSASIISFFSVIS